MLGHRARALNPPVPETENVYKQLEKGINYRKIGEKFGVDAPIACEKVNTVGTDETPVQISARWQN